MRIALGTAQFGLPYGIANQSGQVAYDEIESILGEARSAGLDTLDTAINYGACEQRLGEIGIGHWRVVTKLPAVPDDCPDISGWVRSNVAGSMGRLKIKRLYGLLLHRPQQLLSPAGDDLYRAMVALKNEFKVEKIGVSIYDPEELDTLWPRFRFDLVQAPHNVMDRRIATSGWLARLHEAGTEVHVRSVFLQGLLLVKQEDRPAAFNRWQPLWDRWHCWLADEHLTPLQGCLGFALSKPEIDRVVVGVDSVRHLREILACIDMPNLMPPISLLSEDPDLINPSRWSAS